MLPRCRHRIANSKRICKRRALPWSDDGTTVVSGNCCAGHEVMMQRNLLLNVAFHSQGEDTSESFREYMIASHFSDTPDAFTPEGLLHNTGPGSYNNVFGAFADIICNAYYESNEGRALYASMTPEQLAEMRRAAAEGFPNLHMEFLERFWY